MLTNIQPETYQKKARYQLQDIKHNLKMLDKISQQLDSMATKTSSPERQVALDKSEKLKFDIKQKLRSMGLNINQMICALDYKINILTKQLTNLQKNNKNNSPNKIQKKISTKAEQEYKYQINQLEQRIFELQKKQNQYVKEISQLKQKNAKLRQQFTNLSFDSNQRIKQLSQKLHNNTSPNLTIKRIIPTINPQTSYHLQGDDNDRKKNKNNFVKIKGANNFQQQLTPLQMSPPDSKKAKNMLDSLTSESSQYDIRGLGYELPQLEQNSGNLKFGCFPGKQVSQKTKTGSSSENKKVNFEQKVDKSRRFEFLLNNLMDKKSNDEQVPGNRMVTGQSGYSPINIYTGNSRGASTNQGVGGYQYKPMNRTQQSQQYKSVFNQNVIKRYQI